MSHPSECLKNWIPVRLQYEAGDIFCRWMFTGDERFTNPFFDETIRNCQKYPENSKQQRCLSSLEMIAEWADDLTVVAPTAFIFHVSRCGSTLLSQLLGLNAENISLSEVALFDELLRAQYKTPYIGAEGMAETLKGVVKFYGKKRTGGEKRLFIKTDSWHLLFYKQLRAIYPDVPFVVVYRNPEPVLASNKRKSGMQSIPGMVEPELFGFDKQMEGFYDSERYMAMVLERFYISIIEMAGNDNNTLLLNYDEGAEAMMEKVAGKTNMQLKPGEKVLIAERSNYHAKLPSEKFIEKNVPSGGFMIKELNGLYEKIELLRKKDQYPANVFPGLIY